jgi:hypothetical protein
MSLNFSKDPNMRFTNIQSVLVTLFHVEIHGHIDMIKLRVVLRISFGKALKLS